MEYKQICNKDNENHVTSTVHSYLISVQEMSGK